MEIKSFEPIRVHLDRVGPFQSPYSVDFVKPGVGPSNLFLLASENGRGKTTVFEAMALLMRMLDKGPRVFEEHEDFADRGARMQLDCRVTMEVQANIKVYIISLFAGNHPSAPIYDYTNDDLKADQADEHILIGFRRRLGGTDVLHAGHDVADAFLGLFTVDPERRVLSLFDQTLLKPTLLYFSADRDFARTGGSEISISKPTNLAYSPSHTFGREEGSWANSIDNLFAWYAWLDPRYFEDAAGLVNRHVFHGQSKFIQTLRRDPPAPLVNIGGEVHRLYRLSSGERALTQLFLRLASHMTAFTLLVIDELELHLHPVWQQRLLDQLEALVKEHAGLHVYLSSHSSDLVERLFHEADVPDSDITRHFKLLDKVQ